MPPKFSLNIDLTLGVNAPLVAIFDWVNVNLDSEQGFFFKFLISKLGGFFAIN
jgi:hypothetical protein